MKKTIVGGLAAVGMAFSVQAGTITIGTEATFAPFEFMDEQTHEVTGFDIDVIRAMAKAVGDDIKIHNMGFDALIPSLQTGVIDVTAAAMTITPERQARIDFTSPYYQSGLVILIRKADQAKYDGLKSLEGQRLCAQIGTTGAMAANRVKGAKVTEFNSITEAFMELKNLGCEAVLNDKPVVDYYLARRGDKTVMTVNQVFDAENYGMGVKKGNKALLEKLNKGMEIIRANGEYDKIYQKWFGARQ